MLLLATFSKVIYKKQHAVLNGLYSDYSVIESGVPQDSVLGPLFFSFILMILKEILNLMSKYLQMIKDPIVSANDLNHDLGIIYQWGHQWKVEFNPDPAKQASEVIFSCKKMKPNHPLLVFNGSSVTQVNEQNHLGLILESDLSFEKHINEKYDKG